MWVAGAHFFKCSNDGVQGTAACALRNREPDWVSEAEAATVRSVLQRTWLAPLGLGFGGEVVAQGRSVRKIWSAARLRALGRTR